jgi:hypothetical protein
VGGLLLLLLWMMEASSNPNIGSFLSFIFFSLLFFSTVHVLYCYQS